MQVELMSDGIDRCELESHAQAHPSEADGLTGGSRPFRFHRLNPDTTPLGIAFSWYEVRPDQLVRRRDDCRGTN